MYPGEAKHIYTEQLYNMQVHTLYMTLYNHEEKQSRNIVQLVQECFKSLADHEGVEELEAKEMRMLVGYVCGGFVESLGFEIII